MRNFWNKLTSSITSSSKFIWRQIKEFINDSWKSGFASVLVLAVYTGLKWMGLGGVTIAGWPIISTILTIIYSGFAVGVTVAGFYMVVTMIFWIIGSIFDGIVNVVNKIKTWKANKASAQG